MRQTEKESKKGKCERKKKKKGAKGRCTNPAMKKMRYLTSEQDDKAQIPI